MNKMRVGLAIAMASLTTSVAVPVSAAPTSQYATTATASSNYTQNVGETGGAPAAATGAPNQDTCGDSPLSWSTKTGNKDGETLTLTFASAVVPTEIRIWQVMDPRSLVKVEARSGNGAWTSVLTRKVTDTLKTEAECPEGAFVAPHILTSANAKLPAFGVNQIRLTVNEAAVGTQLQAGDFSGEVDAVQLTGTTPAKPGKSKGAGVSGTVKVGKKLTAAPGTWTGAPTISYAWAACTKAGGAASALPKDCVLIKGANASTFALTKAQKGKFIRVQVTAKNGVGSTISVSPASAKKVS